ncbi:MAG: protein kinase [Chloroflexota bacterium]
MIIDDNIDLDKQLAATPYAEAADQQLSQTIGNKRVERYQQFLLRISKIQGLNHPTIAAIEKAGITDDQHFFVQLAESNATTLSDKVAGAADAPFSAIDALQVISQLSDALAILHELDIVHYALHPRNIFLDAEGNVKLTGFEAFEPQKTAVMTYSELDLGYHAPETGSESRVDKQSNIYSLGIILHELLAGYRPQQLIGESTVSNQAHVTLQMACPDLASTTLNLVNTCLAEESYNRYESMWDVQQALYEALFMEKRLEKRRTTPGLWDIIVLGRQQFGWEILLSVLGLIGVMITAVLTVNQPDLSAIEKVSYFVNNNIGLIPIFLLITLLVGKELVHVPDKQGNQIETWLNKLLVPAIMTTGFLVIVQIAQMIVNITVE